MDAVLALERLKAARDALQLVDREMSILSLIQPESELETELQTIVFRFLEQLDQPGNLVAEAVTIVETHLERTDVRFLRKPRST